MFQLTFISDLIYRPSIRFCMRRLLSLVDEPLRQSFQVHFYFDRCLGLLTFLIIWGSFQQPTKSLQRSTMLPTLAIVLQNMHGGYPEATLERFLNARDEDVSKASKMVSTSWMLWIQILLFFGSELFLNVRLLPCNSQWYWFNAAYWKPKLESQ